MLHKQAGARILDTDPLPPAFVLPQLPSNLGTRAWDILYYVPVIWNKTGV
jgi:hypothetical protein